MKYYSIRVIDADSVDKAIEKVMNGDFDESDSLCDKVIEFRPDADYIISLLEDYDGDGCVTDDLLAYMRSHLQKGGDQ